MNPPSFLLFLFFFFLFFFHAYPAFSLLTLFHSFDPPSLPYSELVPTSAQSSLSSLALVTNFSANLLIGALFLPLQEALSGRRRPSTGTGDAGRGVPSRVGQGNVFYVFTTCLVVGFVVMWKGMKVGSTGPGSGLRRG